MADITIRYLDLTDAPMYGVTMASDDQKVKALKKVYPDYQWDPEESGITNWMLAVQQETGAHFASVREVCRDAADPIWGGENAEKVARWVWFLA